MLTTRDAARLLAAAGHGAPLASLTTPLGFAEPLPLPARELARFGLADDRPRIRVAGGRGSLRALSPCHACLDLNQETIIAAWLRVAIATGTNNAAAIRL